MAGYLSVIRFLRDAILMLEAIKTDVKNSFLNMKTLKSRHKRALLGFMARLLGFLLGTLRSIDLNDIRSNINTLARNQ